MVEMPGCVAFGVRLFSECCALEKVGIIKESTSELAKGAVIGPYAFESCAKLEQLCLPRTRDQSRRPHQQGSRKDAFIRRASKASLLV